MITVPMGSTLTGVEVVTTPNANYVALESEDNRIETNYNVSNLNNTIDIKNPKLTLTSYPEIDADEDAVETNYLDCVTVYYGNAKAPEITTAPEGGYDGHLLIGERTNGNDKYVAFNVNAPAVAGRTYYVSFNVSTDVNELKIRLIYNAQTNEALTGTAPDGSDIGKAEYTGGLNNNYLINGPDNTVRYEWYGEQDANDVYTGRELVQYAIINTEQSFEGYFTPTASAKNIIFYFNRGIGAANTPTTTVRPGLSPRQAHGRWRATRAKNGSPRVKYSSVPTVLCAKSSMQFCRDPYAENDTTYYMVWVNTAQEEGTSGAGATMTRGRLSLAKTTDGKNRDYIGDLWHWRMNYKYINIVAHVVDPFIAATNVYYAKPDTIVGFEQGDSDLLLSYRS